MKKRLSYRCFLIALAGLALFGCFRNSQPAAAVKQVCYKQHCLDVALALTPSERQRGLMFRSSLPQDQGMLFVFERQDTYAFWMKNTYMPLDIVWIDQNLQVVYIKRGVQPCREDPCVPIMPGQKARYVLEGNSGFVDVFGMEAGDRLDFVY